MRKSGNGQRSPRTGMIRATEIVEWIKQLIATSGLRPGDCLPSESDLCDSPGVPRSSLREAVRTPSTLETVEVQHGWRTFVRNATLRPLVETLAFRMSMLSGKHQYAFLEVVEVRWGIGLGEAEQVCSTLRGTGDEESYWLVDRVTEATGEGKLFTELDRSFYVTLMNRMGRRIIANPVAACWDVQTVTLAKLPSGTVTGLSGVYAETLGAAETGDMDGYRRAVCTHYEPLLERLRR